MSRPKIPQLDAVRGIAFLLVLGHNVGGKYPGPGFGYLFGQGWMGVDLFFVLSGFLITGILLDTRDSPRFFQNFYARRCLRIWPLYYTLLFLMFVVIPFLRPAEGQMIFQSASPWWAYPVFLQNFVLKYSSLAAGPLGVTWSLAIEEQFYLVWPLVVRFVSRDRLKIIAAAVLLLSPLLRIGLSHTSIDLYTNLFCRLDGLMAGSLLAILVSERQIEFANSRWLWRGRILFLLAAPVALALAHWHVVWLVYSFTALASVAFVFLAIYDRETWLPAVLGNRFLVYTGTISYGLYLLHRLGTGAATALHLDRHWYVALPFAIALSYGLATLSWRYLEQPFLKLKVYFEFRDAAPEAARAFQGKVQEDLAK